MSMCFCSPNLQFRKFKPIKNSAAVIFEPVLSSVTDDFLLNGNKKFFSTLKAVQ